MSVKVAVRVRPFNSREQKLGCQCIVDMQDPTTILKAHQGEQERKFTFDFSFWSFDGFETQPDGFLKASGSKYADQTQVFQKIGKKILDNAWQGYHCCLFAYGQTGSGKSYSMIGYGPNKGIVPITCNQIFERMKLKEGGVDYEVNASMLQIYNEEVQDLTIPIKDRVPGGLKIRENKLLGVYVDGVKKHLVTSFAQIENVMDMGTKNRTVAATQMNATSSRAHTIITVQFRQIKKVGETKSEKVSMINLVDLAGSQRQDKTGASGQRFKEAVGINQSLTCLGQVISILAKNADGAKQFVPYRNSALTRILQNALGGNSQTIMICAISPANDNYDQSLSTLRYADQAKKIKNKPVVNESQTDKLIRSLKQENERLKKLMEGKGQSLNNIQGGEVDPAKLQQMKKKQEQVKKKEEEFKKKEQELLKKETQQSQKLKKLEEDLFKKELEKQQLDKKKQEQANQLQQKLKAAEQNDQQYENLKKQIEAKKLADAEKEKKFQEEKKLLEEKQKQQTKILQQQQLMIQKSQEQYKRLQDELQKAKQAEQLKRKQEQAKKKEEQNKKQSNTNTEPNKEGNQNQNQNGNGKQNGNADGKGKEDNKGKGKDKKKQKGKDQDSDSDDEQNIEANIKKLNEALNQLKMNQQQIKKQAAKDQEELKKKNEDDTILSKKTLKEKEKENKNLPPYLQNISKDVMINRKMKLVLQKNVLHIGKTGVHPPNDIVFGGRDVNPRHASIHIIDQKVFLKPFSKDCHLYVNGKKVTETIQLVNLDRVIFGWNSCYLFKNKYDDRSDEKINDKDINWDFVRDEVQHLVDIDQSDTEDGGGCCSIF